MAEKKRSAQPGELIFGGHALLEVLKAKRRKIYECYVLKQEPKIWRSISPLLPKYKMPIHHLTKEQMTQKLGTADHQGVAALVSPFPFRKKFFDASREPFIVLLDGILDVRNMGAILRSAYCTGADGVIIPARQGAPLTGAAVKASAGLAERMEILEISSVGQALVELKKAGYNVYVTALEKAQDATKVEYKKPLCVVIGSEETGVSPETLKAGTVVKLPQKANDVSYNASVAAGIVMFLIGQKS